MAQNNSWRIQTLSFQDDPADLQNDQGDTAISSQPNFGQHFGLERTFGFHKKLSVIVGGGVGYLNTNFSSDQIFGNTLEIKERDIQFLSICTGLGFTHQFKGNFYAEANFRVGALSALFKEKREIRSISIENVAVTDINRTFIVNEEEAIQLFLQPEIAMGYKIPKTQFCIQLGLGLIYSPKTLTTGSILKTDYSPDEEFLSFYSYSDGLNGYGISLSISYQLEGSASLY